MGGICHIQIKVHEYIFLNTGIAAVGIDHCMENGILLPWVQEIVDKFHAAYIEISPSGMGIHIICLISDIFAYDAIDYYIKTDRAEVYIPGHTNRFLTAIGDVLNATDVAARYLFAPPHTACPRCGLPW